MMSGMYVLEGDPRSRLLGGAPDLLQQALREVSTPSSSEVLLPAPPSHHPSICRPLLPKEPPLYTVTSSASSLPLSNRLVYKVIYPEDLDLTAAPGGAGVAGASPKASTQGRRYPRKRGRPRRGQELSSQKPSFLPAKHLKAQFGLSQSQIQGVAIYQDSIRDEHPDVEEEEGEESPALKQKKKKTTRSGRISKPPSHIPQPPNPMHPSKETPTLAPVVPTQKPLPKRAFNIPSKYRCRVCNKIYLGNRKMLKHMKLYPDHGPCEEPLKQPPPSSSSNSSSSLTVPIIPMARNQLEDLVKYLDAELVLDVVSKKMFDNFSLWDLVSKKMSSSGQKGIPLMEGFLSEMEGFLSRLKRLFDHCFTATKLGEGRAPLSVPGELTQAALNVSEGPWYLEDPNHIPPEFIKFLGHGKRHHRRRRRNLSDSMEDSNLSAASSSSHSLGAQMVLETNLEAVEPEMEEDTTPEEPLSKRRFSDRDSLDEEEEETEEDIIICPEDESEELDHVDPKRVLEQNGIIISSTNSNDEAPLSEPDKQVSSIHVSTSELALEIESLGPFPRPPPISKEGQRDARRLPSFSSIISQEKVPSPEEVEEGNRDLLPKEQPSNSPLSQQPPSTSAQLPTFSVADSQQPIFSLSSNTSSSSSKPPFLNDLSNVLLGGDTNDFGFPGSALSGMTPLKTPEKHGLLLHSIPPSSMMKEKPDVPPEEGGRTNFLGAISSSSSSSSSSTTFEVAQASRQAPPLEETEGPPASRDSLSSLFDEVNSENIFPPGHSVVGA